MARLARAWARLLALLAVSEATKCPGSDSLIHASFSLEATADASCADVVEELKSRVAGQGSTWHDPHNNGHYAIVSASDSEISLTRTSGTASVGGRTYTDKVLFGFAAGDAGKCKISACSESQVFSVADFSTNYCNIRNLYCGSADGCSPLVHDFTSNTDSYDKSMGAGMDFSQCVVAQSASRSLRSVEAPAAAAPADTKCPGSSAWVHASCSLEATTTASCADVAEEMQARVSGQFAVWHDPHNNGTYQTISVGGGELLFTRTSGSKSVGGKKYTDKVLFTLTEQASPQIGCSIAACSESQTTSVADFSTNYCNMRNLFCGSADGCRPVKHDFSSQQVGVHPSIGAGTDFSACVTVAEAKAPPAPVVAPAETKCPGSSAWVHASCSLEATTLASCADVAEEMQARVDGQPATWHDPHNNGTYTTISSSGGEILFTRTSGSKSVGGRKYTDKVLFTLTDQANGCSIAACSESQVTSVADFSTNYCNMRNLYCGSADGCRPVKHDFISEQVGVHPSVGAGTDFSACVTIAVAPPAAAKQVPADDDIDGFYIDPNHYVQGTFAGSRMVSGKKGDTPTETITLIGTDDGTTFWTVFGKFTGPERSKLTIDFSPKGGPANLTGSYAAGKITFADGNFWTRIQNPPTTKQAVQEAPSNDIGGFYEDPVHYKPGFFLGARMISDIQGSTPSKMITLIGTDDGVLFWTLRGTFTSKAAGFLEIDYSPKGGPMVAAMYQYGTLRLGDGNVWTRQPKPHAANVVV